ncbi:hypothetical protein FM996_01615 [Methylosinus sporium]|uniref:Addiction module protein n=1 Tax=Methylosinus sporium TaxID=428 RepID=A0A549T7K2_METSR|nr:MULTISPECIES: hypothetical protein [Methylosinus]TRL37849.1 hypothetical protein FM996_01615 [Methylosinus sporium]
MTRLLEQAFETIRKLPDPVQDDLARLLLEIADGETQCVTLTSEEESDLTEALAEVERGEFASDETIRAIWAKYE